MKIRLPKDKYNFTKKLARRTGACEATRLRPTRMVVKGANGHVEMMAQRAEISAVFNLQFTDTLLSPGEMKATNATELMV